MNIIPSTHSFQWQKMTFSLPENIQNFARRNLIYSLSKTTSLQRWRLKENSNFFLCDNKETQTQFFNNCKSALNRYEWRHNSVLKSLMNNFITIASEGFRLYADKDGWLSESIFQKQQAARSSRQQTSTKTWNCHPGKK